jgi:pimeloyl-ACP methyl ester carboxylesterase
VRSLRTTLFGSSVVVAAVGALAATTLSSSAAAAPAATVAPVAAPAAKPAAAPAANVAAAGKGLTWGACADPDLTKAGVVCAMLSVPLDYSKPKGTKIQLALSMVKRKVSSRRYQGVMLVNPGGPGGSGLGLATLGQYVPKGAGDAYDWIGFDPRGVGASKPSLSCDPNYFAGPRPLYEPLTPQLERTWLARSKAYAQACAKAGGALLGHMKTTDSARDMESIRVALGQKQINFYGFSYGTYLGQVYATLFPSRLRRAVFDGVVNPKRVWYAANLDQDLAFERNMKIWFAWLAKYDAVYHLGKTAQQVEDLFYTTRYELAQKPAGGVVGADEWTDLFLSAAYYQLTWLDLGKLWADYNTTKDATTLVRVYNSTVGDDNTFAVYNAVQCTDTQWPKSWAQWRRDNWRTFADARYATWSNAWFNAPCLYWPAKAGKAVNVNGTKVAPILLISETLDAPTPYTGALQARALFPKSRLLALPGGTTHSGSLFGNACQDNLIADYLLTGKLPARKKGAGPDAVCAPLPVPDPTAVVPEAPAASAKAAARVAETDPRVAQLRELVRVRP